MYLIRTDFGDRAPNWVCEHIDDGLNDLVKLEFRVYSSPYKLQKVPALRRLEEFITRNGLQQLISSGEGWTINLDFAKKLCPDLSRLDWFRTNVTVQPEYETDEISQAEWMVSIAFYMSPDVVQLYRGNFRRESSTADKQRKIMVVYGRDEQIRSAMFSFLRALSLTPIEWEQALNETQQGAPYIGQVLEQMMNMAQAVIVILTPDEEVRLSERLWTDNTGDVERQLSPQARPNVLFEAGMALALFPDRTIFVQIGRHRDVSDIVGRHVIHFNGSAESRHTLVDRLRTAECLVVTAGNKDWLTAGVFNLTGSNPGTS